MTNHNLKKQFFSGGFLPNLKSTLQWGANLIQIRIAKTTFVLFLFLCFVLQATITVLAHGATYYVSKSGSGSVCSETMPCSTIAAGISAMAGGDTLIIGDGTYNETIRQVPSGSEGKYTTIKAENPFGVNSYRIQISSDYVHVDGIKANGNLTSGAVLQAVGANHVKFTRCAAYGAAISGNVCVVDATRANYILFEDVHSWGGGRYKFGAYEYSDNVIFRRCVARHDYHDALDSFGRQCALFVSYDSTNTLFQNCIGLDSTGVYRDDNGWMYGAYWLENNHDVSNTLWIKDSIILDVDPMHAAIYDPKAMSTHTFSNVVIYNCKSGYYASNLLSGSPSVVLRNMTLGAINGTYDSGDWMAAAWGTGVDIHNNIDATLTDSISFNNTSYGIVNYITSDYNDIYGNGVAAAGGAYQIPSIGSHSITSNPESNGLLYLPRIESGSTLKTAGSGGGQIGAEIMYQRGVSGTLYGEAGYDTLTSNKLWPFPYEDTIKADMASYAGSGPSGKRGFCTGTSIDGTAQTLTKYIWEYLGNQMPSDPYSSSTGGDGSTTGSTYYVRTDGSDSQNGTSNTSDGAWKTLQYAADHIKAGDTVLVADGAYAGFYVNDGGSIGSPKTFQCLGNACEISSSHSGSYAHAGINVEGTSVDYVAIDGFTIHGVSGRGIRLIGGTGIIVKNCLIYNNTQDGILTGNTPYAEILDNTVYSNGSVYLEHNIYVSNPLSDHVTIRGNIVHDANYGNGIQINGENDGGSSDHSDYATIEDNISYHNAANGIKIIASNYATVQNNVIWDNGNAAGGIHIVHQNGSYSIGNTVVNNTIDEPNIACVRINSGNTNNVVFNNICIGSEGIVFEGTGNYQSNNFLTSSSGSLFTDVNNRNYHLTSNSSAIGYGVTIYQSKAAPTFDKDGKARSSAYDAGAYEYGTSTAPSAPKNLEIGK